MIKTYIKNTDIYLLPEKAIYIPEEKALLIADPHFGKSSTFRTFGVAVPGGTTENDLNMLSKSLIKTEAQKLFVLGDLVHSEHSNKRGLLDIIKIWRDKYKNLEITLTPGNHDRDSGDFFRAFGVDRIENEFQLGEFLLRHEPEEIEGKYVLGGHVHPSISLSHPATGNHKFPCFIFRNHYGILPAFGSFTGTYRLTPEKGDKIFITAEGHIKEINNEL